MTHKVDIHKAGGVIVRDRKLLLTRSRGKNFFVAPGGKLENGETSEQALIRELSEELQINVREEDLTEFGTFHAVAAGSDDRVLQMDVFVVNEWQGEITPSSEIEEIRWVSSATNDIEIGSIFRLDVRPKLVEAGLID
jgi:mutator protein MutT